MTTKAAAGIRDRASLYFADRGTHKLPYTTTVDCDLVLHYNAPFLAGVGPRCPSKGRREGKRTTKRTLSTTTPYLSKGPNKWSWEHGGALLKDFQWSHHKAAYDVKAIVENQSLVQIQLAIWHIVQRLFWHQDKKIVQIHTQNFSQRGHNLSIFFSPSFSDII